MFWKIVSYNFGLEQIIFGLFISIIFYELFNVGYYYKKLFNIHPMNIVKPFDCLMCMAFWTTLLFTLSPLNAMANFLIIKFTQKWL